MRRIEKTLGGGEIFPTSRKKQSRQFALPQGWKPSALSGNIYLAKPVRTAGRRGNAVKLATNRPDARDKFDARICQSEEEVRLESTSEIRKPHCPVGSGTVLFRRSWEGAEHLRGQVHSALRDSLAWGSSTGW